MKTYQLTIKIYNSEVTTIIYATNAEQAKLIARSWGGQILRIAELKA